MARSLASIEKEITELDSRDQEKLLRFLLEELDGPPDLDVESAWLDEAARRASEIDAGTVQCVPAEEVFRKAEALPKK
jgi:hypothetical protein